MAGTELMGKSTGKSRIAAGRLGQGEASFVQVIYSFCAFVHPSDREVSSLSPLCRQIWGLCLQQSSSTSTETQVPCSHPSSWKDLGNNNHTNRLC